MLKIGISSCFFPTLTEESFKTLRNEGISALELSMKKDACDALDYKQVKEWADKYGVILWSYHLPFAPDIDISVTDEDKRVRFVGYLTSLIKKASDIGIDKFIIHPSREPIADEDRPARMKQSMRSLSELAEFAASCGAVMAVEDLPRTCLGRTAEDMLTLLSADSRLRVCFDTNHLTMDKNARFMEKLGDKIITLHVSDYDLIDEKHWLPGEGQNDWAEIMDGLEKIGYSGVFMYEVGAGKPKIITRSRPIEASDFVKNAHSIFNREKPETFLV